jgi:hypothetical protein
LNCVSDLIEPLAVMVEDVDALVTDGAVLGPLRRDCNIAQVAPTVLDHVEVLRPVQLRNRFFGRNSSEVRVCRIDEESAEVGDEMGAVQDGVQGVKRRLEKSAN